jgi:hypothetical protein
LKYECNIFNGVLDKDCSNVVTFEALFNAIKNGKWKERIELIREAYSKKEKETVRQLKHKLPAVTWSGVFEERLDDACVVYNKVMVIDIDNVSGKRLEKLKQELRKNPWVYAFFDGPTKGIKALVFIDAELDWHNNHTFEYLEMLFLDLYGIKIDPTGKNPSRLCFVSYDPDMYINPNPHELKIEKNESIDKFTAVGNYSPEDSAPVTDAKYILEICIKMVSKSKTGTYHKGNRNNYIFVLSCLMCEFGVPPELAYKLVFERYSSLGHKEVQSTLKSAYRRSHKNYGTRTANRRNNSNQNSLL